MVQYNRMKKKTESMIWSNRVIINEKSLYRNNSISPRILVCKKECGLILIPSEIEINRIACTFNYVI